MLSDKTIKNVKKLNRFLCAVGSVPFKFNKGGEDSFLQSLSKTDYFTRVQYKTVFVVTLVHAVFLAIRLFQAYSKFGINTKFFLLFMHFTWSSAFVLLSWLHGTFLIVEADLKSYYNGLVKFYGSFISMPGAKFEEKTRRKVRKKPCLIDVLMFGFLIGAFLNLLITIQIFLLFSESYQFVYSALPSCWKAKFPLIIIPFMIYETVLLGINWTLLIFFITIHLIHLLCTQGYLRMLRKNTKNGIVSLGKLIFHYRSAQILNNHYNYSIASFMPLEILVVVSLTYSGNIGTLRTLHNLNTHVITIPEMALLPLVSILTVSFQIIFYTRAGDLHHVSKYFLNSSRKGLYNDSRLATAYLKSFPPIAVRVGSVLQIQKFTVVRVFSGILIGTAKLSILFFNKILTNRK